MPAPALKERPIPKPPIAEAKPAVVAVAKKHGGEHCLPCAKRGDCFFGGENKLKKLSLGNLDNPLPDDADPVAKAAREALMNGDIKLGNVGEFFVTDPTTGEKMSIKGTPLRVPGNGVAILIKDTAPAENQPIPVEQLPLTVAAPAETPSTTTAVPEPLPTLSAPPVAPEPAQPIIAATYPAEDPAPTKSLVAVGQTTVSELAERYVSEKIVNPPIAPTEGIISAHRGGEDANAGASKQDTQGTYARRESLHTRIGLTDTLRKIINGGIPQQQRAEESIPVTGGKLAELVVNAKNVAGNFLRESVPFINQPRFRRGETEIKVNTASQTVSEQRRHQGKTEKKIRKRRKGTNLLAKKSAEIAFREEQIAKTEKVVERRKRKKEQQKRPTSQIFSHERRTELHARLRLRREIKITPSIVETRITKETIRPLILVIPEQTPVEQIAGTITRIAKEKREKIKTPHVAIDVSPALFDQLRNIFAEAVTRKRTAQTDKITIVCGDKRIALDIEKLQLIEHLFADFETQVLLRQLRQCLMQSEIREATVLCGCQQQNTVTTFEKISFCQGCHQGYLQQAFFWLITIIWHIVVLTLDQPNIQEYTQLRYEKNVTS